MNLNAVNRAVTLLTRLFDPQKPTQAFLPPTAGKPVFSETPKPYLPRVQPEAVGVSSHAVADFLLALDTHPALNMHGVTVLHRGRILCEASFGAQDIRIPKYTFSACKSVVSLCIGILIGDGMLSLSDKLVDLFPDRVNPMAKMRLGNLCVKDLLTMRSGIVFNELECQTDEDWIKCFLNSATSGEIGATFSYNSLNTYMLSAILCKKTGMSLSAFAEKRLFAPLGITEFFWETCPMGIERGGWGLYLSQEDMAKLGMLVLHEGRWSDRAALGYALSDDMCIATQELSNDTHKEVCNVTQIVPQDYIRDAVTAHAATPHECGDFDYGYQIWVGRDAFGPAYLFNGMLGQNVLIFPQTDTVIVSNAGNDEFFQTTPYYGIARAYFAAPNALAFAQPEPDGSRHLQAVLYRIGEPISAPAKQLPTDSAPHAAQQNAPRPRGFLDNLRTLFRSTNTPTAPTVPVSAEQEKPRLRLPPEAKPFLDRTFTVAPNKDAPDTLRENAVGLLPVVLQTVHNAYTRGLRSLSFSRIVSGGCEQLLVTYREQEDTHVFPAALPGERSLRSTCTFCGIPFRIAAGCRFSADEDGRPVCILHIDFLETPCSRSVKLFLNTEPHTDEIPDAILRQEETPGASMIARALITQKVQLAAQPIIGGALGIIDDDYLSYRARRMFAPEIGLI